MRMQNVMFVKPKKCRQVKRECCPKETKKKINKYLATIFKTRDS